MESFKVIASGKKFQYAIKFLKSRGGKFDGQTKLWSVESDVIGDGDCNFVGLQRVAPVSAEQQMYSDWSNNPNSNY